MLFTFSTPDALRGERRLPGHADRLGELEPAVPFSFGIHGVVAAEDARDIDALRAGHAVPAGGAADFLPGADQAFHLFQEGKIIRIQVSRRGGIRGGSILRDHLQGIHAGQDDGDFRLVVQPPEGPGGGRPSARVLSHGFAGAGRQQVYQLAAAERLHDDHGNPFRGRGLQTCDARLGGFVQIVVLDLAEIPVVILQDFQEVLRVSVIGKPDIPDGSGFFLFFDPAGDPELLQPLPLGGVRQHMHQVIIDVIRLQAGELLPEGFLHAGKAADHILGQLGGDIHLSADAVPLQHGSQQRFASGIDISGVIVIDARAESGHDLAFRLLQVNGAALPCETHAAIAQDGQLPAVSVFSVLHLIRLHICFTGCIIS